MSYHFHLDRVDLRDKTPLWWHVLIKLIWLSMVSLFLPAILVFEYWLSISQLFLFEAIYSFIVLVSTYFFSLPFTARHGTVTSMLFGVFLFVGNFVVLYGAQFFPWLIIFSPFFAWLYTSFFRIGYHAAMSLQTKVDKEFGKNNSLIESIGLWATLLWPLLWWLLADMRWSHMLYWIAWGSLILSCIPFLFHQRRHVPIRFSSRRSIERISHHTWFLSAVATSFSSIGYVHFVGTVIWSIIMFTFLWTYTKVALLSFASSIFLMIILRCMGIVNDRSRTTKTNPLRRFFIASFWSQSWTWLFATIVLIWWLFSQFIFLGIDLLHKIFYKVSEVSLHTTFYELVWLQPTLEKILDSLFVRELAIHWFRIGMCLLLSWFSALFVNHQYWWLILWVFFVFFIAPLGSRLLNWKKNVSLAQ